MNTPEIHRIATPLLHDYLLDAALRFPDKVALVARGERVSFPTLEQRSREIAALLCARGVARGDRVLVFGDNSIDTVVAFWGVLRANAVVSVVNPLTKADKLAYLMNDCQAVALVTEHNHLRVAGEAAARSRYLSTVVVSGDVDDEALANLPGGVRLRDAAVARAVEPPRRAIESDLAAIIYTSGSTGDPRGVMHTHRSMLTAATSVSSYLQMSADDVVLCALPLAFDYGLYQMIMSARVGARLVLERSFAYPAQILRTMQQEHVTGLPGVPTLFAMLGEMKSMRESDWSHVRYVSNTAAALSSKQIQFLSEVFPRARIYSMYGLTECKRCTYLPPQELATKPGSVGIAIPNTEMWLVDENDRRVGPGQVGQLVIRGPTVMRGYWGKAEATAERLRPGPIPGEHVLYTGDLCLMDDDGYLFFVARMDDVIKSRGEKVAPKEVEQVIVNLPGVREAAVIGVPDEILGQAVKAFVVLESGTSIDGRELQRACQARLESFMVPKHVVFVDALPRTHTGKIKKTDLR